MITMQQLDEIRQKSTAAKEKLRAAWALPKGFVPDPRTTYPLAEAVRETEAAADRAVRQRIAQGCREPRRVPTKHPFSDTDWAAFVASRIALVHAVSKGRNPRLSGGMIANELKRIHRRAGL